MSCRSHSEIAFLDDENSRINRQSDHYMSVVESALWLTCLRLELPCPGDVPLLGTNDVAAALRPPLPPENAPLGTNSGAAASRLLRETMPIFCEFTDASIYS